MRGAYWHVVQTFVGSLLIVVAALIVAITGFVEIDPILGIGFGVILVWAAWGITRDALRILMDTVPVEVDLPAVVDALEAIEGVDGVHHVHAWALTTGRNLFSAHLKMSDAADPMALLETARALIADEFGFYFSTIQVELECVQEDGAAAIDFANSDPLERS